MPRHSSYLTVSDQFCGAGGSSQGVRRFAQRAGLNTGVEVKLALNHWKLAIETHATNFPDALHECTDIQACDPRRYPSTDILITSPECTNHSVAKGKKAVKAQLDAFDKGVHDAAAERSRATMWDVVRFTEYHKYRIIITENVVDARAWVMWDAWIMAMHILGYKHECVFLNSMFCITDAGVSAPQSRDRMYVVFWRKGQPKPNLDIRPSAPCLKCGVVQAVQKFKARHNVKAKYGRQYVYKCPKCAATITPFYFAAINAIDWSLPAERIGERKKPLKERTLQRIEYGLKKYGNRPLSISMLDGQPRTQLASRVKDAMTHPWATQHGELSSAIAAPFMVETKYSHAGEKRAKGMDEPLAGQTGQQSMGVAMPFLMDGSFTKAQGEYMHSGAEPMGTQTTTQSKGVVIPPALMMSLNYPEQSAHRVDEAMRTVTANRPEALITPFLVKQRGTDEGHLQSAAIGMDGAMGTLSAGGNHHALVSGQAMGFLASYYGQTTDAGLDDAMGTLATHDRHALVHGERPALTVDDLYFRMLKAHEVKAGMAFAPDYVVLGNQREQVKQLGNAVTPPAMEILVERCIKSLM